MALLRSRFVHRGSGAEPGLSTSLLRETRHTGAAVTFPLTEKIDVNGPQRHPLYAALTAAPDAGGDAGDVQWNFEKFLLTPDGTIAARFRPRTEPESQEVVAAIEAVLPG